MIVFLSRLILNPRNRHVRRDLADCQNLHRTVLSVFPQAPDGTPARVYFGVLHRLDADPRTGATILLVQSRVRPAWERLPASYLLPRNGSIDGLSCKDVGEPYAAIDAGRRLRFRLRANATEKQGTALKSERLAGERRNGRRVPLDEQELVAWLKRKGDAGGFRPVEVAARRGDVTAPAVRALRAPDVHGWRTNADGVTARRLSFSPALFEGVLEVTDSERFRGVLEHGIGPAKGYGFGLLSIAPA